ncbi:MAG: SGNH/GDSL hydrolase family protein [Butyrivibrio sp.]|nr:SGNH/GDSL hydrolase family protein [Butyrivibrio sp.]
MKFLNIDIIDFASMAQRENSLIVFPDAMDTDTVKAAFHNYPECVVAEFSGVLMQEWLIQNDNVCAKQSNLLPFIDNAVKRNKKIYILGEQTPLARKIEALLKQCGIDLHGYLEPAVKPEAVDSYDLQDLFMDGVEQAFVLVPDTDRGVATEKSNLLKKLGLSIDEHAFAGFWPLQFENLLSYKPDCLVEYSMDLLPDYPGVHVITGKNEGIRILVLGGSTSTSNVFKPKSWVEFFYQKASQALGDVTIYNFAHEANDVVQELLRLIRDGYFLKPDYVISMSGTNNHNVKEGMSNQFNMPLFYKLFRQWTDNGEVLSGFSVDESAFDFWRRQEFLIKQTAEAFGAKYIGFLQPFDLEKPDKTLLEAMTIAEAAVPANLSFSEKAVYDDFYINLLDFFWDNEDMYIDNCHYSSKANELLADEVLRVLLSMQ